MELSKRSEKAAALLKVITLCSEKMAPAQKGPSAYRIPQGVNTNICYKAPPTPVVLHQRSRLEFGEEIGVTAP